MPHHPKGVARPSETLRQKYGRLRLELNVYSEHRMHRRDSLTNDELRDDVVALAEFVFGLAGEIDDDRERLADVEHALLGVRNLSSVAHHPFADPRVIAAMDRIRERVVLRRQREEGKPG